MPSRQICLFVRKSKGDQRRDTRDKLVLAVPIPANSMLADLLDYYSQQRTTFREVTINALPMTPYGASHLWNTPPSGRLPTHFLLGSPSRSAR
jgi:hypothetical protein